jgi:hypothetical protein
MNEIIWNGVLVGRAMGRDAGLDARMKMCANNCNNPVTSNNRLCWCPVLREWLCQICHRGYVGDGIPALHPNVLHGQASPASGE